MSKTKIKFSYEDVDYTLEFTAASLKKMEREGFDFIGMTKRILSAPEELFKGSFIANHSDVPNAKRMEIYEALTNTCEEGESLNEVIGAMISEAIENITNRSGNTAWKVTK